MMSEETRAKAFQEVDVNERQRQVLKCLGDREMTAREVSKEMKRSGYIGLDERNGAAPRLTELFKLRKVVIVAKKKDEETNKTVVVYRKACVDK